MITSTTKRMTKCKTNSQKIKKFGFTYLGLMQIAGSLALSSKKRQSDTKLASAEAKSTP